MGDKYKNLFSIKSVYEIEKHLYDNGSEGFSLMMKAAFAAYEHIKLNPYLICIHAQPRNI